MSCGSASPPSPTAPAIATDPAGSPVHSRPPAPARTRDPIRLGPTGTVVVVEAVAREDGSIGLTVRAVEPDGSDGTERHASAVLSKGWRIADDPRPRVAADGYVALELTDDAEAEVRTAVVDLESGGARMTPPLEGTRATWLPDGSLVTSEQVIEADAAFDLVRRYPDHGSGQPLELRVESPLSLDDGPAVEADLSGIDVVRVNAGDERLEPLVLRWDGTVVERATGAPYAGLGRERSSSAAGATITTWCDDNVVDAGRCGLTWERGDGSTANVGLPAGIPPSSAAWTPDGTRLIIVGAGSALVAREARPVPTVTTLGRMRSLPEEGRVVGATTWAAVVQADEGVHLVLLDGSGVHGPIAGLAAGLLP